jgi:HSP20 family molecular chaperone IbpA
MVALAVAPALTAIGSLCERISGSDRHLFGACIENSASLLSLARIYSISSFPRCPFPNAALHLFICRARLHITASPGCCEERMVADDPGRWMWAEACAMLERAEGLHRQFFQPAVSPRRANWEPPVDIFETERELLIIAALPGVESRDLEVAIDGITLVVAGVRHPPFDTRGASVHRLEIPYGRFERRIRLPAVPLQLSRSELERGCLQVSLAKRG